MVIPRPTPQKAKMLVSEARVYEAIRRLGGGAFYHEIRSHWLCKRMSERTIVKKLNKLIEKGLIERKRIAATGPNRVLYRIKPDGKEFLPEFPKEEIVKLQLQLTKPIYDSIRSKILQSHIQQHLKQQPVEERR